MDNNNFLYTLPPFIPAGEFAQISNLGNIIFVSANAPTSANLQTRAEALGRIDRPFQSINSAFLVSTPGDLIYCLPGTYPLTTITLASTRTNQFYFQNCVTSTVGSGFATAVFRTAIGATNLFLYLENTTMSFTTESFFRAAVQSQCRVFGDNNSFINANNPAVSGILLGGVNPVGIMKNISTSVFTVTVANSQRTSNFENCEISCNSYPCDRNGLSLKNCVFSQTIQNVVSSQFSLTCLNSTFNSPPGFTFTRIVIDSSSTINIFGIGNFIQGLNIILSEDNYFINNSTIYCNNFLNRSNPLSIDFLRVLNTSICNTGNVIENPTSSTLGRFIFISCNFKNNFTPFELTNPANIIVNPVVSSFISSP